MKWKLERLFGAWIMKTPVSDGFTVTVIQNCWDIIKEEHLKVFAGIHCNGEIGVNMNTTFITCMTRKDRSCKVKDYGPISLVTCVHKLIIEVLCQIEFSVI